MEDNGAGESLRPPGRPAFTLKPRHLAILTLMLLLLGLAWRAERFALNFPIWGDEAFVANGLLVRDYQTIFLPPLEHNQVAPPLFMFMELAISRLLGFHELALRLPAFVAGLVALLLFAQFARRNFGPRSALLAVGFLAVSYYAVRHASEIKPYALDLAISMGLTMLAWNIHRGVREIASWISLILLGGVSVWFSLPAIFVLSGIGVFLLVGLLRRRQWNRLIPLAVFGVVVLASFAAQYVLYLKPMRQGADNYFVYWENAFPPLSKPWKIPLWLLEVHCGNMLAYPAGSNNFGSTGTFLLVVCGFISLWKARRRDLLLLLLAPLAVTLLASFLGKYPYGMSARTMLFMAPAFCLLAGEGGALLASRLKAYTDTGLVVGVGALACVAIVGMAIDAATPYKAPGDALIRSTFDDLARDARPGDQWIFVNSCPTEIEKLLLPERLKAIKLPGRFGWSEADGDPLFGVGSELFRFYAATRVRVDNRWGPRPEDVPAVTGRTFLLSFNRDSPRSPQEDVRPAREKDFVRQLADRLGPPTQRQLIPHVRSGKPPPMIMIYEFGPAKARM